MSITMPKSPLDFTKVFIRANRGERAGIHSVFSGYNEALKATFNLNPIEFTQKLVADGVLVACKNIPTSPILVKRGAYLVLKEDADKGKAVSNKKAGISKKTLLALQNAFGDKEVEKKAIEKI